MGGKTIRGGKKLDFNAECYTVSTDKKGLRAIVNQLFISNKTNEISGIKELELYNDLDKWVHKMPLVNNTVS